MCCELKQNKFSPTWLSKLTLFDELERALTFPCPTEPVQNKHALFSWHWGLAEVPV
jgi:hypothetical protein